MLNSAHLDLSLLYTGQFSWKKFNEALNCQDCAVELLFLYHRSGEPLNMHVGGTWHTFLRGGLPKSGLLLDHALSPSVPNFWTEESRIQAGSPSDC